MPKHLTDHLKQSIISYLRTHDASKISLFGSYVRGEETENSDLDILVEFSKRKSLMDLVSIEYGLSEKLQIKIDLVTEKSINPYLIDKIKDESLRIFG